MVSKIVRQSLHDVYRFRKARQSRNFQQIGDRAHLRRYSVRKPWKLIEFPTDVLPHEAAWLQEVQQFQPADNRGILEILVWRELRCAKPAPAKAHKH